MNRQAKPLQKKAKKNKVYPLSSGDYDVVSATSSAIYRVRRDGSGFVCECKWSRYHDTRRDPCTHVLAVQEHVARNGDRRLSWWADPEAAQRQHRPTARVGGGLWATSRKAAT